MRENIFYNTHNIFVIKNIRKITNDIMRVHSREFAHIPYRSQNYLNNQLSTTSISLDIYWNHLHSLNSSVMRVIIKYLTKYMFTI